MPNVSERRSGLFVYTDTVVPERVEEAPPDYVKDPARVNEWLGVLEREISIGLFSEINKGNFPKVPVAILRLAQRQAFWNHLRNQYQQKIQFPELGESIEADMVAVVRAFEKECLGILDVDNPTHKAFIDVKSWEPHNGTPAELYEAVEQGRYDDVVMDYYLPFANQPFEFANYRLQAISNAHQRTFMKTAPGENDLGFNIPGSKIDPELQRKHKLGADGVLGYRLRLVNIFTELRYQVYHLGDFSGLSGSCDKLLT